MMIFLVSLRHASFSSFSFVTENVMVYQILERYLFVWIFHESLHCTWNFKPNSIQNLKLHSCYILFAYSPTEMTGIHFRKWDRKIQINVACIFHQNLMTPVLILWPTSSVIFQLISFYVIQDFMHILGAILRHYKIQYHIYTDDYSAVFFLSISISHDEVLTTISTCISDIRTWMIQNKLKINDDKTEFLLITSSRANFAENVHLNIGKDIISPTNSCRSLGVMLDSHFTMDTQINSLCWATHFHLHNIAAIRDQLTTAATEQLIHSLVSSRLDYCNSLLYGVPQYKINYLQRVQNICSKDCDAMFPTRSHHTLSQVSSLVACRMPYCI